ncbi:TonB-dependent receptor domain-containing protein [Erythrobacter mangrovi]|uniref:TonB-dependent receptor n=1 Tax=Erythrobacter mangrovi TaxID=2739433 RepID=A0A7D4BHH5_9SPHN|nr:TonB-dependent receptor [Erythrobacter mangrovi]QKG72202.1 TonB-dependent receptor [Erythrobacter mangrovi]
MNRKSRYLWGTILSLPLITLAASPASAQSAPASDDAEASQTASPDPSTTIIVTGSYIRGTSEEGVLPVDVFGLDELNERGIDSPLEFIKTLPSVGPVLGDSNQYAAGGSQGVGSINLRSLGRERTLVLMNGQRFFPEPGDGAADTNLIPLFALQRVEVLKDGAASTYGSDAIAGVANFITRKNFEGIEVAGNWQFVNGSDDNYQASILAGKNFGAANILVGAGFQHRSELPATERAFTQRPYEVNPSGWSPLNNPGVYLPQTATGTTLGIGIDGRLLDACDAVGGIEVPISTFTTCRYSYVPFVNLIEKEDRYQVYGQVTVDLSDTLSFHADALYSHTEVPELGYSPSYPPTQSVRGPGTSSRFIVPRSNPFYQNYIDTTFGPGSVPDRFSAYSVIVLWRPFGSSSNPLDPRGAGEGGAFNNAWRITGGFEKEFSDSFRVNLDGLFLRSHRKAFSYDFVSDRLQRALNGLGGPACTGTTPGANGCQYRNPFISQSPGNAALGLTNPAYVPGTENSEELITWARQQNGTSAYEELWTADLVFSGETQIGGMELGYAFGAQHRDSHFVTRPVNRFSDPDAYPCAIDGDRTCLDDPTDNLVPVGAFTFLGQYPAANLSQSINALFAEVKLNPIDSIELIGAVRFEDYGDPVGSTINPKFSARVQATDFLALRGSIGTTFRGPLPGDLTPAGASAVAGISAINNEYRATDSGGNPDLDPETALTYNVGAVLTFGGFTFSADFWTYEFEGRFTDLPFQAIANLVAPGTSGNQLVDCSSPFTQFVTFQGGACTQGTTIARDIARIRTQTVNGPDVTTRGLDLTLNYNDTFGSVDVNVGINATTVLTYKFGDFEYNGLLFSEGYEAAGWSNFGRAPGTVSKWRGSAFASLGFGRATVTYNALYISGVDDNRCYNQTTGAVIDPCAVTEFGGTNFGRHVGSYMQHDLLASVDLELAGVDVTLTGGVENIFDRDPAGARLEYGYDPFIGTSIGRTFKIATKVRF